VVTPSTSTGTVDVPAGLAVLAPFIRAGVVGPYEVHLVATVARLEPGLSDEVALALAVAARAPRFGHVCWRLDDMGGQLVGVDGEEADALPWPDPAAWARALVASPLVASPEDADTQPIRPLVWDAGRLYLHRYWHYELAVADDLSRRASPVLPTPTPGTAEDSVDPAEVALDALFGPDRPDDPDLQRRGARRALRPGVSIIAGGPGTGKTYTVARLLAAAHAVAAAEGRELEVALAAPTGKAAARMGDAVKAAVVSLAAAGAVDGRLAAQLTATDPTTVHSLLGWRNRTRFRHDREDPLPHDLVVIDETSMVSLPLMAKVLDAVRPEARLVLVGDPFQLASIEAGTVMRDVVGPAVDPLDRRDRSDAVLGGRVTVLSRMRRFGEDSSIAVLADAVRRGDADAVVALLAADRPDLQWVDPGDPGAVGLVSDELVEVGEELVTAALDGDAAGALSAADRVKVLAATRRGRLGRDDWTARIEEGVATRVPRFRPARRWHVGRPVLVTANDRNNRVFNGDVGVVVARDEEMVVAMADGSEVRELAPSRLEGVETWWAMTVHKSQGSEFDHAVVSLPDQGSPILTRELLYTAITRARHRLTIVATEAAVRAAVDRPLARASGLWERLWSE
jgi:exodeoxyribonuclease V alpha subunit